MRITDYGTVSCWYEHDLLAKIDREIKHKQHGAFRFDKNKKVVIKNERC